MRHFRQQHHEVARLLGRRLITVVLLLILAGMVHGVWGVFQKEREAREKRIDAEIELAELKKREKELQAELADLKTDRGMEARLRQQFEVAKEGEGLIVIVDRPDPNATPPPPPKPWWEQLLPW